MTPDQAIAAIDDEVARLSRHSIINRATHKRLVEALETLLAATSDDDNASDNEAEVNALLAQNRRARLLLRIAGLTEKAIAYGIALPEDFLEHYEQVATKTGLHCRSDMSFMLMKQHHSSMQALAASDVETIKSYRFFLETGNNRMAKWLKENHPMLNAWFAIAENGEYLNERRIFDEQYKYRVNIWN